MCSGSRTVAQAEVQSTAPLTVKSAVPCARLVLPEPAVASEIVSETLKPAPLVVATVTPRVKLDVVNEPPMERSANITLLAETSTAVVFVAVLPQSSVAVQVIVVTAPASKLESPEPAVRV